MNSQCHDCCMAQALIDQKDERIAELEKVAEAAVLVLAGVQYNEYVSVDAQDILENALRAVGYLK